MHVPLLKACAKACANAVAWPDEPAEAIACMHVLHRPHEQVFLWTSSTLAV